MNNICYLLFFIIHYILFITYHIASMLIYSLYHYLFIYVYLNIVYVYILTSKAKFFTWYKKYLARGTFWKSNNGT